MAYPIVFSDIRGWTPGFTGLSFCGIAVGSTIVIICEPLIRKIINSHKLDPVTGEKAPESMVSVVCLAAILIPAGEIWFAWTCVPVSIHWIVPILAGIPFGQYLQNTPSPSCSTHKLIPARLRKCPGLHIRIRLPSSLVRHLRRIGIGW